MMRWLLFILLLLAGGGDVLAQGLFISGTVAPNRSFVPLHTYFMAATGCNDANAGTSAGAPWCTPNHAGVCGDVIIAAAGTYTNDFSTWGTVSTCPSVTGGIDGLGGIYAAVLLCGGSDITSCKVDCSVSGTPCNGCVTCNTGGSGFGPAAAMSVNSKSNWAIEGWTLTCGSAFTGFGNECTAFQPTGCIVSVTYIFLINALTYNNGQSWAPQDCTNSTAVGADYNAVVGVIAQNSAQSDVCIAAIDVIRGGKSDADTTHTHWFIYNNYSYNNPDTPCDTAFDGEDFMLDTPGGHQIAGHIVFANNVGFYAERYCIHTTDGGTVVSSNPLIKIYNNTCTYNNQRGLAGTAAGELQQTATWSAAGSPSVQIWNNIAYSPWSTPPGPGGSGNTYALVPQVANPLLVGNQVRAGAENILQGTPSPANDCFTGNPGCGHDTSVNPNFKNTTDLVTNHLGVPNCFGFRNTTQCMGWDAASQRMTALSILDDLTANATGGCPQCAGKGFQKPSTTCISSGDIVTDYPTWLKGLVYLHWTGSAVVQNFDLVTLPCGL